MASYEAVLREVEALSEAEQFRLVAQLSARLYEHSSADDSVSIIELQGPGREIWQGQDAQEYVTRERSAWNR